MIHRFKVQNFKSILDVTVELAPVTVLVGRSGTGKSNFVEAIRTLRDILKSAQGIPSWTQVTPATQSPSITSFEVEFTIAGIPEQFIYRLTLGKQGPNEPPIQEILKLGDTVLFHQEKSKWVSELKLLQPPPPGPIAIGRIPAISEAVVAFTALTAGIGCYSFRGTVLAGGPSNQSSSGLDDEARNYLHTLKEIATNLQDLHVRKRIVASLQQINSSVSSVELDNIQQPKHVVVGHRFNGKTLDLQLAQESDGFRRFYAHLLALYQRPPKQTMLFEHPEDGIHPGALAILAEEFKAAPDDRRGQIILTTHSPKLLDHFDADQIRVVELDGFETRIGPVSQAQREALQEDLLDAGELLTVDPARLDADISEAPAL